jgi:hypothetical protein
MSRPSEAHIRQRQETFLFSRSPDRLWGPTQLPMQEVLSSFPGVKRPERDVNRLHLPPSSRMGGAIPLFPIYALMAWRGTTLDLRLPDDIQFALPTRSVPRRYNSYTRPQTR